MKILVTGGFGQIASHLVFKLLNLDYQIDVVDNLLTGDYDNLARFNIDIKHVPIFAIDLFEQKYSNVRKRSQILFFEADFEEEILLRRISSGYYNMIFHFAAITNHENILKNIASAIDNNITRTFNLLNCAIKSGKTNFVFATNLKIDSSPFNVQKNLIENHIAEIDANVFYLRYDNLEDAENSFESLLKSISV